MTKAVAEYKSPAHKLISMLHVGVSVHESWQSHFCEASMARLPGRQRENCRRQKWTETG